MADKRIPLFYDATLRRYRQVGANDALSAIMGADVVLGEAVAQHDLLYIDTDGLAYKADKSDDTAVEVKYIALEAGLISATIQVAYGYQDIPSDTTTTDGKRYFLGAAGAKVPAESAPTTSPDSVVEAGVGRGTEGFHFAPQFLVRL